jgi:hypothetical protein
MGVFLAIMVADVMDGTAIFARRYSSFSLSQSDSASSTCSLTRHGLLSISLALPEPAK